MYSRTLVLQCICTQYTHYADVYTFYIRADDGVRLYIDEETLIDEWETKPAIGTCRQEHSAHCVYVCMYACINDLCMQHACMYVT